jgi:hypothetical protein
MIVEFFGVRGSHSVTGPNFQKFGGNTSCVLVTVAGRRIVLDAGTGLINVAGACFNRDRPSTRRCFCLTTTTTTWPA